jgi:hypothetical protein
LKEENKNLKYKIEMLTIDKSDHGILNETKMNTLRNFIISEMNGFNEYLLDLGVDQVFHKIK